MSTTPERPNIVFLFSDEHRWCSCPFTEAPEIHTPNLAKLAERGTRIDNCCSTSPICVPYRGMLITGQWPHQSSCISNEVFLDPDIIGKKSPTIADVFKEQVYATGYIGKWHLQNETVYAAGFDEFTHWLYGDDHWNTQVRDVPSGEDFKEVTGYNATGMTDQALAFLDKHAGEDDPFLLMVSLNPPHFRWDDAPEELLELYPDETLPFRSNVEMSRFDQNETERFYYRNYLAHISAVDKEVGRVMDALDAQGLTENTVFIYTSDHGSSFWSNGAWSKANPFDESVRVPFIAQWPGHIEAGRVSEQNMGTMDLFPTLCGLAGIQAPDHCGGRDLSPNLLSADEPIATSQFLTVNSFRRNYYKRLLTGESGNSFVPCKGVRTSQYSYVVNADGPWFLYDNVLDSLQQHNLVNKPDYAEVQSHLHNELQDWLVKAENPFLPESLKPRDISARIRAQNEYYSVGLHHEEWKTYKENLKTIFRGGSLTMTQDHKLDEIVSAVVSQSFFGLRLAYENELKGNQRYTDWQPSKLHELMNTQDREAQEAIRYLLEME